MLSANQSPLAGVQEQQADLDQLQASQRFASAPLTLTLTLTLTLAL